MNGNDMSRTKSLRRKISLLFLCLTTQFIVFYAYYLPCEVAEISLCRGHDDFVVFIYPFNAYVAFLLKNPLEIAHVLLNVLFLIVSVLLMFLSNLCRSVAMTVAVLLSWLSLSAIFVFIIGGITN